jgi:hypothetical protein
MGWNVHASSCRVRQPPARLFPGFPRGGDWILGRMRMTYCSNSVPSRNPAESILTTSLLVAGLFKSVFH